MEGGPEDEGAGSDEAEGGIGEHSEAVRFEIQRAMDVNGKRDAAHGLAWQGKEERQSDWVPNEEKSRRHSRIINLKIRTARRIQRRTSENRGKKQEERFINTEKKREKREERELKEEKLKDKGERRMERQRTDKCKEKHEDK
jgi:hypothetical protein